MRAGVRYLKRQVAKAALVVGVVGLWLVPGRAVAATIPVGCTGTAADVTALRAAITTSNASAGPDTITLGAGCTYTLVDANNFWFGPDGLPPVAGELTIEGNGATIARDPAAPKFRFFFVGGDPAVAVSPGQGSLTLFQLTLRGGLAKGGDSHFGGGGAGMGGAVFNQGTLVLDRVTLTANTAQGGGATTAGDATGGGGIGSDSAGNNGGGFGGGFVAPVGAGTGGDGNASGGGGGAGFGPGENGGAAAGGAPGAGGGANTGLGAKGGGAGGAGGDGSGGGGQGNVLGGDGGGFGVGGLNVLVPDPGPGTNGAGGGGVGGGGGGGFGAGAGIGNGGLGGAGGFGGGGGEGGGGPSSTGGAGGFGGGGGLGGPTTAPGGFGGGSGGGGGAGMGGAVFNLQGSVTVSSSTLATNTALGSAGFFGSAGQGLGGAIFNLSGTVSVSDSTLAANTAAQGGGAIYNLVYDSATTRTASVALVRSVLADSAGGVADVTSDKPGVVSGGAANQGTAAIDRGGSLVEHSSTSGTGSITGAAVTDDPLLGPLADNGGPTPTMLPGDGGPAIDAGGASGCPGADQRGLIRPTGAGCDLGSVERATPSAVTGPSGAIGTRSAGVSGTAGNPGLAAGTAYFAYGTTTFYGTTTPVTPLAPGSANVPVAAALTGLAPGTTYHYTLIATGPEGIASGGDRTFTTAPAPSIAITTPADGGLYGQDQAVATSYTCTGIQITACAGPVASGAPLETATLGAHAFTVNATDASGLHATKTVHYTVIAVPLLACQRREVALIDVHVKGKRVVLSGVTEPSFAGQVATITMGTETVGHATVERLGTFSTTLKLPPRKQLGRARYQATVAGHRSTALKLQRHSFFTRAKLSVGKLRLAGGVTGSFKPGAKVTIQSITLCTKTKRLGTTKLTAKGTWKLTLTAPKNAALLLYRARTKLGKATTYTLPTPATQ